MTVTEIVLFALFGLMEVFSLIAARNLLRFNAIQMELNALAVQREAELRERVTALEGGLR